MDELEDKTCFFQPEYNTKSAFYMNTLEQNLYTLYYNLLINLPVKDYRWSKEEEFL